MFAGFRHTTGHPRRVRGSSFVIPAWQFCVANTGGLCREGRLHGSPHKAGMTSVRSSGVVSQVAVVGRRAVRWLWLLRRLES